MNKRTLNTSRDFKPYKCNYRQKNFISRKCGNTFTPLVI